VSEPPLPVVLSRTPKGIYVHDRPRTMAEAVILACRLRASGLESWAERAMPGDVVGQIRRTQ
jgi:hypothetical protein